MKVDIRDAVTFQSLPALAVVRYLRAHGWTEHDRPGDKASIWIQTLKSGDQVEVLLPLQASLRDYALRMAEVFSTLSKVENRSQLQILEDIRTSSSDIVRVRLNAGQNGHHSLLIEDAVLAVARTREMMLAAACAAVEPRAYYHSRKFVQATDYVRKLRLGQSEPGSYVFTVLSPVPPEIKQTNWLPEDEIDEPFERQVSRMLMRGLVAAQHAAERTVATGNYESFQQAVQDGVSANLCEALVGLAGTDESSSFEISLSWSSNRLAPRQTFQSAFFTPDVLPVFSEYSRVVKEKSPRDEFELEGVVVRLDQEDEAGSRTVRVMGSVEGKMRKVEVTLSEGDFSQAIQSFQSRIPVRIFGELTRSGHLLTLQNPRHFEVLNIED